MQPEAPRTYSHKARPSSRPRAYAPAAPACRAQPADRPREEEEPRKEDEEPPPARCTLNTQSPHELLPRTAGSGTSATLATPAWGKKTAPTLLLPKCLKRGEMMSSPCSPRHLTRTVEQKSERRTQTTARRPGFPWCTAESAGLHQSRAVPPTPYLK
ncbi:hypothetical protein NDU88_006896 [Pleurodeles waltl]|uniref:Uncharacterized protein n=1 Tax=Pleurodeles waltl TaxID=8319 RepID=A0AAV7QMG7_PLEWA|nr:hypothetical protein NDU88_006896 [Pleurodeles waltl]